MVLTDEKLRQYAKDTEGPVKAMALELMERRERDKVAELDAASEVLFTCPECGEQSYEDMGGGALRCCDCGEHFTKTTGQQFESLAKDGE